MKELNFNHDKKPQIMAYRAMNNRSSLRRKTGEVSTINYAPKPSRKSLKPSRFNRSVP